MYLNCACALLDDSDAESRRRSDENGVEFFLLSSPLLPCQKERQKHSADTACSGTSERARHDSNFRFCWNRIVTIATFY